MTKLNASSLEREIWDWNIANEPHEIFFSAPFVEIKIRGYAIQNRVQSFKDYISTAISYRFLYQEIIVEI